MAATKSERLDEIMRRLKDASPFSSGIEARSVVERIFTEVEDALSGILRNPDAVTAPTDGRMYPPNDAFEVASGCQRIRTFKQLRHRTSFGDNGAIKITYWDGTVVIDLRGADGKSVTDLFSEKNHEVN